MNTEKLREQFESWAEYHLGQGYPLTMDEHTYENPVTRWAFVAYKAAHNAQQELLDVAQATIDDLCEQLDSIDAGHKGMC
jgi:hypothetical protein